MPARKKKKTTRKKARKSPARKKATTRRRKKATTRRRKSAATKRPAARRRRRSSKPARRRRSNPPKARRRTRKTSTGVKFKSGLKSLMSKDTLKQVAAGVFGFGAALAIPRLAKRFGLPQKLCVGYPGVATTAVSAVAVAALANAVGAKKSSKAILMGGLTAAGVRLALMLIPASQASKYLPISELTGSGSLTGTSAPASSGINGYLAAEQVRQSELGNYVLASQLNIPQTYADTGSSYFPREQPTGMALDYTDSGERF